MVPDLSNKGFFPGADLRCEIWQVNFQLDTTGVRVLHHHQLTQQFRR
jgi:hypothetical protein